MLRFVLALLILALSPAPVGAEPWFQKVGAPSQVQLKNDVLAKLSELIHVHEANKRLFAPWISLGDMKKFRARIEQPAVRVDVDPKLGASASYTDRDQTIHVARAPAKFFRSMTFNRGASMLLWHEAIHAISHGHQTGAISPARPFKSAPKSLATSDGTLKTGGEPLGPIESVSPAGPQRELAHANEAIDHLYINWAESCMQGTEALAQLEDKMVPLGKAPPPPDVAEYTRRRWKRFVEACNSTHGSQVPDAGEREELERMIGFRVDPAEVLGNYLKAGWPAEYFSAGLTDAQAWSLFPTPAQLGVGGLTETRRKTSLGSLSVTYIKAWSAGAQGRQLSIHLTFYGSPLFSGASFGSTLESLGVNVTHLSGVGERAYILHRGPRDADFLVARFWNATIMISDTVVRGSLEEGNITTHPRAPNPNFAKLVFDNLEALGAPPVVPGLITRPPKTE